MFYRIHKKITRVLFGIGCKGILRTPPIIAVGDQPIIVSLVSHSDVLMYLVAIKSFYKYFGRGSIAVLNDGTLVESDLVLLRKHIKDIRIVDISEIPSGKNMYDISWKRFYFVCDCMKESYVIQLDSDTLTRAPISEVSDCVRSNRSFIISGDYLKTEVLPMEKTCENAKNINSKHVQAISEKSFDKLPDYSTKKYVRGCGGFTGFVKGGFSWADVEMFSESMHEIIGSKWSEWGGEQTAVNYFAANLPETMVLPYGKYCSFVVDKIKVQRNAAFLHFIGTDRFKGGYYIKYAREAIANLRGQNT